MTKHFLLLLFLFPTLAYAQEPAVHPIDKSLETCTEKDPTTAGMITCTDLAYKKWDRELNKNYDSIYDTLQGTTYIPTRLDQTSLRLPRWAVGPGFYIPRPWRFGVVRLDAALVSLCVLCAS